MHIATVYTDKVAQTIADSIRLQFPFKQSDLKFGSTRMIAVISFGKTGYRPLLKTSLFPFNNVNFID